MTMTSALATSIQAVWPGSATLGWPAGSLAHAGEPQTRTAAVAASGSNQRRDTTASFGTGGRRVQRTGRGRTPHQLLPRRTRRAGRAGMMKIAASPYVA